MIEFGMDFFNYISVIERLKEVIQSGSSDVVPIWLLHLQTEQYFGPDSVC